MLYILDRNIYLVVYDIKLFMVTGNMTIKYKYANK